MLWAPVTYDADARQVTRALQVPPVQFSERYVQVRRCRRWPRSRRALLGDADQVASRVAGHARCRPSWLQIGADAGFEEQLVRERRRPRRLLHALAEAG